MKKNTKNGLMAKKNKMYDFTLAGREVYASIIIYARPGSKSPEMVCLKYNDRLITPFEFRVRNWAWTINSLLIFTYRNIDFEGMVSAKNPFLELIPKNDCFEGNYIPIPIKW